MPATSRLDGPPPSPALMEGQPAISQTQPQMSQLAGGQSFDFNGAQTLPPEVVKGAMDAAETVAQTLDGFAQMFPSEAPAFGMARDLITQAFARVLSTGGVTAASPGAAGSQFPGSLNARGPGAVAGV